MKLTGLLAAVLVLTACNLDQSVRKTGDAIGKGA